jgi:hypothetical protein
VKEFKETISFNGLPQDEGTAGIVDSNAAFSAGSAAQPA